MTDQPKAPSRPRRSMLYMPGSNPRALEKAKTLAADSLILDLEDAVAVDAKAEARRLVAEAVKGGGYGPRELIIRINGLDTPWGLEDLQAACAAEPDAILLPKVESAEMVQHAEALMTQYGAPARTTIWCMMETPRGILRAEEIAGASKRLGGFVMGTNDLTKELQARHTPDRLPLIPSFALCLLAARAEGLAIIDGTFTDLNDDEGLIASCRQGVELGFDGKTLLHPKQLAAANEAFAPSDAEIEQARRIIEAFEKAETEGKGVVLLDGKLVENLHVAEAKNLLAKAEMIARLNAEA